MRTSLQLWFNKFFEATTERPTHIVFNWDDQYWDNIRHPTLDNLVYEFDTIDQINPHIMTRMFDSGFGVKDSPDFCAWSENYVILNDNYNGAETICWVPRNPKAHKPIRHGGG